MHKIAQTLILTAACIMLVPGCSEPDGTEPMDVESITFDEIGSLLVLAGNSTTPAIPMMMVDSAVEVTVTIVPDHAGGIAFADHGMEATIESHDGYLVVPPITADGGVDEASLEFRHGDALLGSVGIHVVPSADLQSAKALLEQQAGTIVASEDGFVFVDEQAVSAEVTDMAPVVQAMTEQTPRGLCIETPFGAGQVHWLMANPKSYGYSIDNEDAPSSLQWASAGTQAVDAIYRTSWGCTKALKIPDSCTANVAANGSIECCCNGLFYLLGFQCKYINPSQDPYFTNCPL